MAAARWPGEPSVASWISQPTLVAGSAPIVAIHRTAGPARSSGNMPGHPGWLMNAICLIAANPLAISAAGTGVVANSGEPRLCATGGLSARVPGTGGQAASGTRRINSHTNA